jgi:hypothetical protein
MMWKLKGVDRSTGERRTVFLECDTRADAEAWADGEGIQVRRCRPHRPFMDSLSVLVVAIAGVAFAGQQVLPPGLRFGMSVVGFVLYLLLSGVVVALGAVAYKALF